MGSLQDLLDHHVAAGWMPGAVAAIDRGGDVEWAVAGDLDLEGSAPFRRDSPTRIASLTKPIMAATVMTMVDESAIALDDPVTRWLPELADLSVVRTPSSPVDDVVPAERLITVEDVLSSRAGWGFPADFSLPALGPIFSELHQGPMVGGVPGPDEWLRILAGIPLLHQPGQAWLYNTCSDLQGVLVQRVTGRPLGDVMRERLFEPLGMVDTGFSVSDEQRGRFATAYRPSPDGDGLELVDRPDGQWSKPPEFASGAGGLVSTVADWTAFGRMLLAGGRAPDGRALVSEHSVRLMTTDHLTAEQRDAGALFLEGQGWGYGGSVDVAELDPWNEPGRYGWVGGTGTSAHVMPATDTVAVLLTQREMTDPTPPTLMRDFWRLAAS